MIDLNIEEKDLVINALRHQSARYTIQAREERPGATEKDVQMAMEWAQRYQERIEALIARIRA